MGMRGDFGMVRRVVVLEDAFPATVMIDIGIVVFPNLSAFV
jgi:hypothetical protein